MAAEDEEAEMMAADVQSALGALDEEEVERKTAPSTLDGTTQSLINLLFDLNMFKSVSLSLQLVSPPVSKKAKYNSHSFHKTWTHKPWTQAHTDVSIPVK